MSNIKTSASRILKYRTAIVDRVFLNRFLTIIIKDQLELESISISSDIKGIQGTDINEILDKVAKEQIKIKSVWISAREPWDREKHLEKEQKRIQLYASDYFMSIDIKGDDIDWVYGKENAIDTIVNKGSRRHRLLLRDRVLIVPENYEDRVAGKRLSSRDKRVIFWTFLITIFAGVIVALLIELIKKLF